MALHDKAPHDGDLNRQHADMNAPEKRVMDTEAHATRILWWNRIIPQRSHVKGFKISPSGYVNLEMSMIGLAVPHCGEYAQEPSPKG